MQIIDYISLIDSRRAYLPKHTSLFAFLTNELGYCPATAQLRINALRALKVVPEIREDILNNNLSLNQIAKTQVFISNENKVAKLQSAEALTFSEQRQLFDVAKQVKPNQLEEALNNKKHEIDTQKAKDQGLPPSPKKPCLKKFYFEADKELQSYIDELKTLLSHQIPDGDLALVLKQALPKAINEIKIAKGILKRSELGNKNCKIQEESKGVNGVNNEITKLDIKEINKLITIEDSKEINKVLTKEDSKEVSEAINTSMKLKCSKKTNVVTRNIPKPIKRAVWKRDGGRCQYIVPETKKKCHSTFQIQLDHIMPWSLGGEHSIENIMCTCSIHNRHRSVFHADANKPKSFKK